MPGVSNKARDRRLIKRKVNGETLPEIAAQEGMTKNGVFLALKRLEPQLLTALKRADYGLDKAVMKMVELADAEKTEFFAKDGVVTQQVNVRDNGTCFKARETLLRLHRGYGDDKAAPTNVFGNGPVMVIVGASNDRIKRLRTGNMLSATLTQADETSQEDTQSGETNESAS
jgi:hypothetical protein